MKTITMICWKRPEYLEKALMSILDNTAVSEFDCIYIFAEPHRPEKMEALIETLRNTPKDKININVVVHCNAAQKGTDQNGHDAVAYAFNHE